jgi:hypothetical protein
MGIEAGHETGTGGAAAGGIVELRKAQAVGSQAVKMRSINFSAVATDIRVAHIVGHDKQDVRPLRSGVRCLGRFSSRFVFAGKKQAEAADAEIVKSSWKGFRLVHILSGHILKNAQTSRLKP